MDLTQVPKNNEPKAESGIALFMVIAAMMVLSVIVTEFTYIAQVNQRMAYDSLDQIKAHYLAKSGFKWSLLKLKAYQRAKELFGNLGGGGEDGKSGAGAAAASAIPKSAFEQIWKFPLIFPVPTALPGLTPGDKDRIAEFQKEIGLEGNFTALTESESSKYNLNSILAGFTEVAGSPSAAAPSPKPNPSPSPAIVFDQQKAREGLLALLHQILIQKMESDPDFANDYRDFKLEDLEDSIMTWADRTFEGKDNSGRAKIKPKRAPFYTLSELHMIYPMDDQLYDLFAPNFTVSVTPGLNVNTIKEQTVKALFPKMTKEEVEEFFKFRDSDEDDNLFKSEDEFYKYLEEKVADFKGGDELKKFKESLAARGIRIVTDETIFKITVQAQVNQATKLLEAMVVLGDIKKDQGEKQADGSVKPVDKPIEPKDGVAPRPDAGIKVTYMRIL